MFENMFAPGNCFCGAVLVFFAAMTYYHSTKAGLLFAAIPVFFGFVGILSGE